MASQECKLFEKCLLNRCTNNRSGSVPMHVENDNFVFIIKPSTKYAKHAHTTITHVHTTILC